ncbi:MAG: ABC transporter substrate-binding protein, partial [Actinomycetota bacterium]|nr:ABC transporter substrate-binding protein [Actinomycetota bacterium]
MTVARVGAVAPLTGRYAVQGRQMRAGLELWADRSGAELAIEDDRSEPARAAVLHEALRGGDCRFVIGPYGSDSTRACAAAADGAVVWNHGAAADDVQRMPGVISVPSPASGYLVALGGVVAKLRPHARIALAAGRGRFAGFAVQGLERAARSLGLELIGRFALRSSAGEITAARPDAVLACGPLSQEAALFRAIRDSLPEALVGGVSPGLRDFSRQLGGDPDGFLAPVQWHPDTASEPELGPRSEDVVADARARGYPELDYIAAQAYAVALIADRCTELAPDDPHAAARRLTTTTFFGAFGLD